MTDPGRPEGEGTEPPRPGAPEPGGAPPPRPSLWDQVPDADDERDLPWARRPDAADQPTQAVPPVPPTVVDPPATPAAGTSVPAPGYREATAPPVGGSGSNTGLIAAVAALVALIVGLVGGLVVGGFFDEEPEPDTAPQEQVAGLEAELARAQAERAQLEQQLGELGAANAQLTQQLAERDVLDAELQATLEAAAAEREQALADLAAAEEVIATLEDSLAAIDDAFSFTESLVGTQVSAAETWAEARDLRLIVREVTDQPEGTGPLAPGTVLAQAPDPGTPVLPGSVIYVEVLVEDDAGGD